MHTFVKNAKPQEIGDHSPKKDLDIELRMRKRKWVNQNLETLLTQMVYFRSFKEHFNTPKEYIMTVGDGDGEYQL